MKKIIYTYSLTARTATGHFYNMGFGCEPELFQAAVAIDREGGELLSAVRDVWEEIGGVARFLRAEPYRMGIPVTE
jgi:hypothetical protein